MLNWLSNLLSSGPKKKWVVELSSTGFVTDASIQKGAKSDGLSHTVTVEFDEPVREDNDVSHLNMRYEGQVIQQIKLLSGDTSNSFGCNPYQGAIEMVTVDSDDHVVSTEELTMDYRKLVDIYDDPDGAANAN